MTEVITSNPSTYFFGITEVSLQKDTVASKELVECVADRISGLSDLDGLHHAGVTELTHAQLSVKQLRQSRM